jgi:hypothetical protein
MSRARDFADLAGSADAGGLTGRNLIINGAMQVAQRGTSFSSVTTGAYHLDRFKTILSGLGTWTMSQSTTAPTGFSNSLKYECTTADASPAAGDYMALYHNLEGQNIQHLKKGTASAESLTLSFWVRSNKTGTYQVNLYDDDNNRVLGSTYSVSSADTWEYKTITYSGDTTGALDNDNALSLHVEWWLGSGTNFSSGTIPASWSALDNTDRNASGTVNLADTVGNTFYITGVQLEVGEQATPFEHRSYGDELARCQRYTWKLGGFGADQYLASTWLYFDGSTIHTGPYYCPVQMRADPSLTQYGTPVIKNNGTAQSGFNFTIAGGGKAQCFSIVAAKTSHGLSNTSVVDTNTPTTSDYFILDAEL